MRLFGRGKTGSWKAATPAPGERPPLPNQSYGSFITGFESFAGLKAGIQPIDPAEANEGIDNAIVSICIGWIATSWPIATPQIGTMNGATFKPDATRHPFLDILEQPNPETEYVDLQWALNADFWRKGNAYAYLTTSRRGDLLTIDWIPARYMRPMPDRMGRLAYYEYSPNGEGLALLPANVVHFRYGIDEENPLQGVSPLAAQWREIVTDNRYSNYAAGLAGSGTPATVFTPKVQRTPSGDVTAKLDGNQAAIIARKIVEKFRRKPGEAVVVSGALDMHRMGIEPDKMALNEVRSMPETRIPACFGLPPIVLNLWTGLQRSTYNNSEEATQQAWRGCLIPTQKVFAGKWKKALRLYPDGAIKVLHHDYTQVPELAEDMSAKRKDARDDHEAGLITLEEARSEGGRQTTAKIKAQLESERQPAVMVGAGEDGSGGDSQQGGQGGRPGGRFPQGAASSGG